MASAIPFFLAANQASQLPCHPEASRRIAIPLTRSSTPTTKPIPLNLSEIVARDPEPAWDQLSCAAIIAIPTRKNQ